jgi:hypothetical protein
MVHQSETIKYTINPAGRKVPMIRNNRDHPLKKQVDGPAIFVKMDKLGVRDLPLRTVKKPAHMNKVITYLFG